LDFWVPGVGILEDFFGGKGLPGKTGRGKGKGGKEIVREGGRRKGKEGHRKTATAPPPAAGYSSVKLPSVTVTRIREKVMTSSVLFWILVRIGLLQKSKSFL
jgi:hypothetical protein